MEAFSLGMITPSSLRDIYKLNLLVSIKEEGWSPIIELIEKPNQSKGIAQHFKTYDEAYSAGFKECIKLIKNNEQ